MARAIITPDGVFIEDGTKAVILPSGVFVEDQAAAAVGAISDYRFRQRYFG